MSGSGDSEAQRAAIEKVQEGARLLVAKDYDGAIAACSAAIQLNPQIHDAYLFRSEAYRLSERRSPLLFISEIAGFILGSLWWLIFDAADAMEQAHGGKHKRPSPRFRERERDESERTWKRVEVLLGPAALTPKKRNRIEAQCMILRNLGIDAQVDERVGKIQVAEGPIRGVTVFDMDDSYGVSCWVPDSHIVEGYPYVSAYPRRASSFPWFGRPKQVWWGTQDLDPYAAEYPDLIDEKFSLRTIAILTQNSAVTEGIRSIGGNLHIETDRTQGCWEISLGSPKELTRPMWDCCQAIAEALLAMPIPGEG